MPWDMLMITWEFGRPEVAVFSLKPIAATTATNYEIHTQTTKQTETQTKVSRYDILDAPVKGSRLGINASYTTSRMMAIANRIPPIKSPIALYQTNKQLNGTMFNHVISIQ
ncbi:hypothetical protein FOXG_18762 [Fusarium oxysporum f. sp. lycopersici 4287]|uniref:Uncharacterized protein n=2 Tax=Fusarium oxysporum TaxID=5507 RepID=A0A0J9UN54_FUSO4|nr:hypothetical protein FOXG_18762 [Fusarium oxysporum f. sp. lycopersici 4287]EXK44262.1 hypothetical protein FOMG_03019 [Fusarium oxysporum f. sp. melonis 26406]KNB00670.1 hypothetical protein FOXG_18762 [Fusarium oxysporum f. sp. lycopersici 4287]